VEPKLKRRIQHTITPLTVLLTIDLPETAQSFEVRKAEAFFVPEGVKHEYHNFTDKVIKAVFIVAPQL
jgi:mannose-6-phosphate isomerase-like protein (cupin superfamily)